MTTAPTQEKANSHFAQRDENLQKAADFLDSNPNEKEHYIDGTRLKRHDGFIHPGEKRRFRGYAVMS